MTFLPIVERELRVAARKKNTFLLRAGTALLAMLISGPVFLMSAAMAMGSSSSAGLYMFKMLAHYTYVLCLLAGVFFASECLSEERREGTLGFLFLTDLKGYDIVLGKFAGISLNAFYALLALFPVLALPLLTGGVTGGEFWRMMLALGNALFFSIAAGVWISSFTQTSFRSTSGTLSFLVIVGVVVPLLEHSLRSMLYGRVVFWFSLPSPYQAIGFSSDASYLRLHKDFWLSLAVNHLTGWVFLSVASWYLPRTLETKIVQSRHGFWHRFFTGEFLGGARRRRIELMELNPILWLLTDSLRLRWLVWLVSGIGCAAMIALTIWGRSNSRFFGFFLTTPFIFIFKVLFAIQACRFFSESRRTGSLELLCCTPLTNQRIIQGQWLALRKIFLWPILILLFTSLVPLIILVFLSHGNFIPGAIMAIYFLLEPIVNFFAIGWFGMWLALSGKKPGMATGLTILFVTVLPSVLLCIPGSGFVIDIIFIAVARAKLQNDFRILASGQPQPFSFGSL